MISKVPFRPHLTFIDGMPFLPKCPDVVVTVTPSHVTEEEPSTDTAT